MYLFLLSYLAIYGGAHAYLMTRTVRAFHLPAPYPVLLTLLSLLMIAAPIMVRVFEHHGMEASAKITAHIGYFWMGFFFLFLSASIALDLARGLFALAGLIMQRNLWLGEPRLIAISLAVALAACVYGVFEAGRIKVEQVTLKSPKIRKSGGRIRLVQISDVHLGLMVGKERLQNILALVSALKPDVLLSTGDLVDGQMDGLRGLYDDLAALKAPLGKFAVLGNHEAIAGLAPSETFTEKCGFRLLREESVAVADCLTLAGVDDPFVTHGSAPGKEQALLAGLPAGRYTILLKHRPKVEQSSIALFDLQLSGHVHKGQIFPFNLITHLVYPAKMGLSQPGRGSFLYVSRGTGTWGPPIRVLAPPEITVIDLFPAS